MFIYVDAWQTRIEVGQDFVGIGAQQRSKFFAGNRLTTADLRVFVEIRGLNSGRFDHIPADLVEQVAPNLNAHMQRIANLPAVQAYYAQFAK